MTIFGAIKILLQSVRPSVHPSSHIKSFVNTRKHSANAVGSDLFCPQCGEGGGKEYFAFGADPVGVHVGVASCMHFIFLRN